MIFLLAKYGMIPQATKEAIQRGDTDTVAAVVLGIAFVSREDSRIWDLVEGSKTGRMGREYDLDWE